MLTLHEASLLLLAVVLVAAAAQDVRTMQIANGYSLAVVALFVAFAAEGLASGRLPASSLGLAVTCGALVLVSGMGAFSVGALGGGDVKLLAAVSLFAGSSRLVEFLAVTAVAGGGLGLAHLAGLPVGRLAGDVGAGLRSRLRGELPFGPAIAAGGLWLALSLA